MTLSGVPTHGFIIIFLIMLVAYLFNRNRAIQDKIVYFFSKAQYKNTLINHMYFIREYKHLRDIDRIKLGDEDKTKIFTLLLRTKINSNSTVIKQMVSKETIRSWRDVSRDRFRKLLTESMVSMVDMTNSIFLKELSKIYGEYRANEIYDLIVKKEGGFDYWRQRRLDDLDKRLDIIFDSHELYSNNYRIMDAYLIELDITTSNAIESSIQKFKNYNGDLTKIIESYE